jgi:hypothetical protein
VRAGAGFEIDFYEQGTERMLRFDPVDDHYILRDGYDRWGSDHDERIAASTLSAMLNEALNAFMLFLRSNAPHLEAHPLIQEWAQGRLTAYGDVAEGPSKA